MSFNLPMHSLTLKEEEVKFLERTNDFEFNLWRRKTIATMSDSDFGAYLAGLIEGDGSWDVNRLEICFDIRDVFLARAIAKRLNADVSKSVVYRKGKKEHHEGSYRLLLPRGTKSSKRVVELVNSRLVGPYKVEQLRKHLYNQTAKRCSGAKTSYQWVKNFELLPPDVNNMWGFWLTGFFDADGCIEIPSRDGTKKSSAIRRCRIGINQVQPVLLDLVGSNLGLKVNRYWQKKAKKYRYEVRTHDTTKLGQLLNHFDHYPCQGIKHGRLFFAKQALWIKEAFYRSRQPGVAQIRKIYFDAYNTCVNRIREWVTDDEQFFYFNVDVFDSEITQLIAGLGHQALTRNSDLAWKLFTLSKNKNDLN